MTGRFSGAEIETAAEAVEWERWHGEPQYLIECGFPGCTVTAWADDLDEARRVGSQHVALHRLEDPGNDDPIAWIYRLIGSVAGDDEDEDE